MGESPFVDTGAVSGSDLVHFQVAADGINARLAGPMLMEGRKGDWGASPKEFRQKVAEQMAVIAEGAEVMQMGRDGNLEPTTFGGHPEILAAAQNGTLKLLVGVDSRGCRRVSCAILQSSGRSSTGPESVPALKLPKMGWQELVAVALCALVGGWLLSRPEFAALSSGQKFGVLCVAALVLGGVMTWVSMRRGRS